MTHVAMIHGGGDSGSAFVLLAAELRRRGHTTSAVDLPIDDPDAGLGDLTDAVLVGIAGTDTESPRDPERVLVVAHSWGGLVGPLVAERLGDRALGLVMLAAMVPRPGETGGEWWTHTGHDADLSGGPAEVYYNGVPGEVAERALAGGRDQVAAADSEPWPLAHWPAVPTHVLLFTEDRVFPLAWMSGVIRDRLGVEPDTMPGGHTAFLGDPAAVADRLEAYLGA